MSTRSMAARRRRAADRRKKRDTPAPQPAKLIPGPAAFSTSEAEPGISARTPELDREPAGIGAHTTMPPLDRPLADDLRYTQEMRLPPLAAPGAEPAAPAAPKRPLASDSERAIVVRRYRDSGGTSRPPSQPPRLSRPSRPAYEPRPRDGFSWRERDWGGTLWLRLLRRLPTVIVSLALLAVVLGGTFLLVTHAVGRTTLHLTSPFSTSGTPTPRTQPVIIQPGTNDTTPTPAFPQYTIGVWAADPSPPGSGSDQLFARISDNLLPAKGIAVTFSIDGLQQSGRLVTDGHGLVTYTLVYSGQAGQPIEVTATANTPSGVISATIYIVPV